MPRALRAGARRGREGAAVNGAAVRQRRHAISYILHALSIATADANRARYAFLIYNASVYYWSIVRPMLREGAARHAKDSMTRIVEALEESDGDLGTPAPADADGADGGAPPPPGAAADATTRWRIQYLCALAFVLDDAGRRPAPRAAPRGAEHAKALAAKAGEAAALARAPSRADDVARAWQARLRKLDGADSGDAAPGDDDDDARRRRGRRRRRRARLAALAHLGARRELDADAQREHIAKKLLEAEREKGSAAPRSTRASTSSSADVRELERVYLRGVHVGRHASKEADASACSTAARPR